MRATTFTAVLAVTAGVIATEVGLKNAALCAVAVVCALVAIRWINEFGAPIVCVAVLIPASIGVSSPVLRYMSPAVAGLVLVALVLFATSRGRPHETTSPREAGIRLTGIAALTFVAMLTVFHPSRLDPAALIGTTVVPVLAIVIWRRAGTGGHRTPTLVGWIVATLTVASVLAIMEPIIGRYLLPAGTAVFHPAARGGFLRAQGVFPHPIILGVALIFGLLLAISRVWSISDRRGRYAAAIVVMTLAELLTFSRGAWLGCAIAVGIFVALHRGIASPRIFCALGALVLILVLTPFGANAREVGTSSGGSSEAAQLDRTAAYRSDLNAAVIEYAAQHPIGNGPGSASSIRLQGRTTGSSNGFQSIDNTYALWALELGWIGLAFALAVLAAIIGHAWATLRRLRRDVVLGPIAAAILAAELGFVVAAYTVSTLSSFAQLNLLFWLVVGAQLSLSAAEPSIARLDGCETETFTRNAEPSARRR